MFKVMSDEIHSLLTMDKDSAAFLVQLSVTMV